MADRRFAVAEVSSCSSTMTARLSGSANDAVGKPGRGYRAPVMTAGNTICDAGAKGYAGHCTFTCCACAAIGAGEALKEPSAAMVAARLAFGLGATPCGSPKPPMVALGCDWIVCNRRRLVAGEHTDLRSRRRRDGLRWRRAALSEAASAYPASPAWAARSPAWAAESLGARPLRFQSWAARRRRP